LLSKANELNNKIQIPNFKVKVKEEKKDNPNSTSAAIIPSKEEKI